MRDTHYTYALDGYPRASCWLAQFAPRTKYWAPCAGPTDPAHLIPKQLLKRKGVEDIWDKRLVVPACRFHHANFDQLRFRVPREALPEGVEEAAKALRLESYLDRFYGPLDVAA